MSLPEYYYVAALAAVLIGVSKGGFAASFNMVVMPMLALATDPVHAAVIMLPVMCVIDLFALWTYSKKADAVLFRLLLTGSFVGLGVGAFTFTTMNADAMRVLLGVIALLFGGRGLWQFAHFYRQEDASLGWPARRRRRWVHQLYNPCRITSGANVFVTNALAKNRHARDRGNIFCLP